MKKSFVIIAAAVAAIAVSCTKNELTGPEESGKAYTEFIATMGDEVKTALDPTTGSVAWAEGDAIKILWKAEDELKSAVSLPLSAEGAAARPVIFKADCSPVGETFGVYPSSIEAEWPDYLGVTIPSVQSGNFSDVQILAARLLEGKMAFKNVCGYLQFSVPAGVNKVVWTSDGVNSPAGEIKVNFTDGVFSTDGLVSGTGKNEITVNVSGAGTYYAAVAPGTYSSLYVAMFNGETLVGERQTFNKVEVASAQVKRMGTIPESFLANKYFVKVAGAGTKDGSSWDNAADVDGLRTLIASADADGKSIYMAAGKYVWTSDLALKETTTFKVFGGFPADIAGESLAGRDPKNNETIFDGDGQYRIFVITKPSVTLDGLVFQNAYRNNSDNGVAVIYQSCPDQTVNNCIFRNNVHDGSGAGGAMRVAASASSTVTVTNSIFENNIANEGDAGAVYISSGTYLSENNIYRKNVSGASGVEAGGGAIKVNGAVSCIFDGDLFDGNKALSASSSAIFGPKNVAYVIKCNNTAFINNRASSRGCLRASSTSGKVYLNACTFARDTVQQYGSALQLNAPAVVHNCVFFQNINNTATGASNIYHDANLLFSNSSMKLGGKSSAGIHHQGGINSIIVNSILYNSGSNDTGNAGSVINMAAAKNFTSYGHNIIGMFNADDSKSPVIGNTSNYVQKDSDHTDYLYTCKKDSEGNLSWHLDPQYIGAPYYVLKWTSWPAPGKPESYQQTDAARVEAAIDAFDAAVSGMNVKAWLQEIGSLNTDRRGILRSATGNIWPGSYDNSATSTLE